jgi:hypothetical protein
MKQRDAGESFGWLGAPRSAYTHALNGRSGSSLGVLTRNDSPVRGRSGRWGPKRINQLIQDVQRNGNAESTFLPRR